MNQGVKRKSGSLHGGPWRAEKTGRYSWIVRRDHREGEEVCRIVDETEGDPDWAEEGPSLPDMLARPGSAGHRQLSRTMADLEVGAQAELRSIAHLLAAAPDLLNACREALDYLEAFEGPGDITTLLRTAVARATGGEP